MLVNIKKDWMVIHDTIIIFWYLDTYYLSIIALFCSTIYSICILFYAFKYIFLRNGQ